MTERHRSSPELDAQLRNYLEEQQKNKDEGYTVSNVLREVTDVKLELREWARQVNELDAKVKAQGFRLDRHGRKIADLEAHVFNKDPVYDTGIHQIEDLRKHLAAKEAELEERKKNAEEQETWWKRKKIEIGVAAASAAAALTLGGVGTVLWYLLIHATERK